MLTRTRAAVVALLACALVAAGFTPALLASANAATASITVSATGARGIDRGVVELWAESSDGDEDYWEEYDLARLDAGSSATFGDLEPGRYRAVVDASHAGRSYARTWFGDVTSEDEARTIELGASNQSLAVVLAEGYSLAGRVGGPDGSVEGTDVVVFGADGAYERQTVTNASGGYVVGGLAAGQKVVHFTGDVEAGENLQGEYYDDHLEREDADLVTVGEGQEPTEIDATLAKTASISGTVSAPGGMFEYAEVVAHKTGAGDRGETYEADVAPGGRYSLAVPAGTYQVEFPTFAYDEVADDHVYYAPEWWKDQPTRATAQLITVAAEEEVGQIDATLEIAGSISGRITVDQGDPELASVTAYLDGEEAGWAGPDADGRFEIVGLGAGSYTLGFNREGEEPFVPEYWENKPESGGVSTGITVAVQNATTTPLPRPVQLARGGSFKGTIIDVDGKPVEDALVRAYTIDDDVSARYAFTGPSGGFRLEGLAPGQKYFVQATRYIDLDTFDDAWFPSSAGTQATATTVVAPRAGPDQDLGTLTLGLADLTSDAPPELSGTPKVGQMLTAAPALWSEAGTSSTFEWKADGLPVARGTQRSYAIKGADAGKRITVTELATKRGFRPASTTSDQTATVAKSTVTPARPAVTGTAAVGRTLTASVAPLPVGVSPFFTWFSGGRAVSTGRTYTVRIGDVGKSLTVQVKGVGTGYTSTTATSAATGTVAKAPSRTTLTAKGAKKRRATLTVVVSATGTTTPGGTVTIKDGSKAVRTVAVPRGGRVVVALTKLKVGKHTFTAAYDGSAVARGSSASARTTVKK